MKIKNKVQFKVSRTSNILFWCMLCHSILYYPRTCGLHLIILITNFDSKFDGAKHFITKH